MPANYRCFQRIAGMARSYVFWGGVGGCDFAGAARGSPRPGFWKVVI
jgi:hypothetical protein